VLGLGGASATASAHQRTTAAPLVFDRVTVVDVEAGKLVPDQRVIIVGTRIQTVGGASAVPLPPGAQVVDAQGKYLIPGLWDMHVHPHRAIDIFYPLFLANGVTGIRDAWSTEPLDSLVQWWREILAGTRVGPPRQLLAGRAFGQHYQGTDEEIDWSQYGSSSYALQGKALASTNIILGDDQFSPRDA
jgi:hypothetical protein